MFYHTLLRKQCPYSELLWSVFSRIQIEYGEMRSISSYSVWMRKSMDQKNSEYGNFHSVLVVPITFQRLIFIENFR